MPGFSKRTAMRRPWSTTATPLPISPTALSFFYYGSFLLHIAELGQISVIGQRHTIVCFH
jgi:hypothetical protein